MASYILRNRVALLKVAAPPVNSLGLAARKGLADGLARARQDGAVAVVIAGEGGTFPAGADIGEFAKGGHLTAPTLGDIIAQRQLQLRQERFELAPRDGHVEGKRLQHR